MADMAIKPPMRRRIAWHLHQTSAHETVDSVIRDGGGLSDIFFRSFEKTCLPPGVPAERIEDIEQEKSNSQGHIGEDKEDRSRVQAETEANGSGAILDGERARDEGQGCRDRLGNEKGNV